LKAISGIVSLCMQTEQEALEVTSQLISVNNTCMVMVRESRDSAVGIETGYCLDGRGFEVPVGHVFSPLHIVHTGSVAHPAPYPIGTGGRFLRG
jgi:hypothetical protein